MIGLVSKNTDDQHKKKIITDFLCTRDEFCKAILLAIGDNMKEKNRIQLNDIINKHTENDIEKVFFSKENEQNMAVLHSIFDSLLQFTKLKRRLKL